MLRNAGTQCLRTQCLRNTVFAKSDFLNGDGNESGNLRKNKEILRDALRNVHPLGAVRHARPP